jgi:hypothetical protein
MQQMNETDWSILNSLQSELGKTQLNNPMVNLFWRKILNVIEFSE